MTRARHVLGTAIRIIAIFFSLGIALYALSFLIARERMFPPPLADAFHARPWARLTLRVLRLSASSA